MRHIVIFLLCLAAVSTLSCASSWQGAHSLVRHSNAPEYRDYDVVLEARPLLAKKIEQGSSFDAVADEETELTAIVTLKISRIVKGDLPKLRMNASSRASRFDNAVKKEKTFGAVIGSMIPQKTKIIARTRFSVAVRDPAESFGVTDWEQPVPVQYRLYLRRYKYQANTYIIAKKEKIETPEGAGQ